MKTLKLSVGSHFVRGGFSGQIVRVEPSKTRRNTMNVTIVDAKFGEMTFAA